MDTNTTKEIADKLIDLTNAGVIEIYSKLQQVAPELWKLVVKQVKIDGVECFIGAFFGFVALIYCFVVVRLVVKGDYSADTEEGYMISGIISGFAGIILTPIFLINGLDYFLNPEYWALKDILNMIRH